MTDFMPRQTTQINDLGASARPVSLVMDYWASLRQAGSVPSRAAIDARALGAALPHVFLAELVTSRVARLRICGHQIEQLLDMDMRGMPLSTLFAGAARADLTEALAQVARGVRVTLALQGEDGFGLPALNAKLVLLPLTDDAGQINRILGVLETEGRIGRTPRRFVRANITVQPDPSTIPAPASPVLRVIQGGRR